MLVAGSLDTPHLFNLPSRRDSNALPASLFPSLPQFTIVTTNFLMMFVIKCHDGEASVTAQDDGRRRIRRWRQLLLQSRLEVPV